MRKFHLVLTILTVVVVFTTDVLNACGAKFLVASRSARFQRAQKAAVTADILVFQHTRENGVEDFTDALRDSLKKAGHKVTVATDANRLRIAAESGDFNVVMLDLDQARSLRDQIAVWSPETAILPMVAFATRSERSTAKREFGQVLSLPAAMTRVLSAVDQSL